MFMWFFCSERYWWSVHTSSSFVIDWCWHFLCGKYSRISIVFLIIYWCWLFFMCKKLLSFSTDVYVIFCYWKISMKCTHIMLICHLLMLTYFLCGKYSRISILVLIIYWCWLFFMCNMFLSFSTDVYVSFCYWNISIKYTHFIFICHLLMLTYFLCGKYSRISILVLIIYWCPTISILFLIIYWCWLFFMCQSFFKKVSLSGGHKVSLRKFL